MNLDETKFLTFIRVGLKLQSQFPHSRVNLQDSVSGRPGPRMKLFVFVWLAFTLCRRCACRVPTCEEIDLMKASIYQVVDGQISRVPNAVRFGK